MDGNSLFAATAAGAALIGLIDRFVFRRGEVTITNIEKGEPEGNYMRFVLQYHAKKDPDWSELSYSFRDKKCPTTVIAGKTRAISGCKAGLNQEYLLIRRDLLTLGDWELTVNIVTTDRLNLLFYSHFPLKTSKTLQVEVTNDW